MKKLYSILVIHLLLNFIYGQSSMICSLPSDYVLDKNENGLKNLSIQTHDNDEIYKFIEQMMNTVNLPMNFHVNSCDNDKCRNNAFAAMNKNGTRFIVYDNLWFEQIRKDSTNIEILTILSHEIGHHLSGHTLDLNLLDNLSAINLCDSRSSNYNQKQCDTLYKNDYADFLHKQRRQELQADRFSGYIMNMIQIDSLKVQDFISRMVSDEDDINSTHPRLSRRLKAIEEGYLIAEKHMHSKNTSIDLLEIKGNDIEIILKKTDDIEKNKTIRLIKEYATFKPQRYLVKNSKDLGYVYGSAITPSIKNQISTFLGRPWDPDTYDYDNFYFEMAIAGVLVINYLDVKYTPLTGVFIKNGILKIVLFEEHKSPRVIYKSIFDEDEISLKEIEALFVELMEDGIRRKIREYEND